MKSRKAIRLGVLLLIGLALASTWALVSASAAPPATITVNPAGTYDHYGIATISGTMACAGQGTISLYVLVEQPVGRKSSVSGNTSLDTRSCGPVATTWLAQIAPGGAGGKFAGGSSAVVSGNYYASFQVAVPAGGSGYPAPPYPNCYLYSIDPTTGDYVFQCNVSGTFGPQPVKLTNK